jgi:hypothetical protein
MYSTKTRPFSSLQKYLPEEIMLVCYLKSYSSTENSRKEFRRQSAIINISL